MATEIFLRGEKMKIAVCMKQVPAYSEGSMDEKTGALIRQGLQTISNIYDVSALEAALQIKEQTEAEISVFTMGPKSAEAVVREAYSLGADAGYLICDNAFAGADVLSTSYTLMQTMKDKNFDLILCGRQTTDGDTAQVSGALAHWLGIAHINWVVSFIEITKKDICVSYVLNGEEITALVPYTCLLSVEKNMFVPRMPSLKLKMAAKKKPVQLISLNDIEDSNASHYGFSGSATRVVRIFPPTKTTKQPPEMMGANAAAEKILQLLKVAEGGTHI